MSVVSMAKNPFIWANKAGWGKAVFIERTRV